MCNRLGVLTIDKPALGVPIPPNPPSNTNQHAVRGLFPCPPLADLLFVKRGSQLVWFGVPTHIHAGDSTVRVPEHAIRV